MSTFSRRNWIKTATTISAGLALPASLFSCGNNESSIPKTILLVSGWQDVNIGDIAHTPGLLNVLQTFLPDTKIILWKRSRGEEVKQLLNKNFPKVNIIYGDVDEEYNVEDPEVLAAFEEADIMIHGSGPSVVGRENLEAWVKNSEKPFGIFGTTIQCRLVKD